MNLNGSLSVSFAHFGVHTVWTKAQRMRRIMNACTRCTSIFGHKLEETTRLLKNIIPEI